MIHIFLDTNVILDYLLDRQPFSVDTAKILTLSENSKIKAYISTLTIANCYYLMRKDESHKKVVKNLEKLCEFVEILDFPKSSVINSFKTNFSDFEDSIQNEVAKTENKIKTIITRNIKDFKRSTLDILTPEMFLNVIKNSQASL